MTNLLSIDLEDWYHFIGDPAVPAYETWTSCPPRVEQTTETLLEMVKGHSITFFCLGFIARQFPQLIKRIAAQGHEIACHGFKHDFVFEIGPDKFRRDIADTKALLEDLTGTPCLGYRAPGFSIRETEPWALEIIAAEGFLYDSSVFPAIRTAGGIKTSLKYPYVLETPSGGLVEIPISTSNVLGITTAFCGGGFFRFFPEAYIHRNIKKINGQNQPAVVYIHPRDIDPLQPRMKLKPFNGFLYYYGLDAAAAKFKRLVDAFDWSGFGGFARDCKETLPVSYSA